MSLPPFLSTSPQPISAPSSARLKALYASTSSQKESNPTGYNANVTWWSGIIEECLRNGWIGEHRLVLRVDETLLERFENAEGSRPKGLGGVVDSMMTPPAKLHPLPSFLSSPTPIHDPGSLTYRFVARPLLWTVGRLNPFGGGETIEKEEAIWKRVKGKEFVHLSLLERAANSVIDHIADKPAINYSDTLFSLATLRETFGSIAIPARTSGEMALPAGEHRLSEKDVEVLVKWLHRDRGVICTDGKLNRDGSEEAITEADRGTLAILSTIKLVDKQVESLSAEIANCTTLAKDQLRKSQKTLAMATLRKKKSLEEVLDKRLATSDQLHKVLGSIDQAQNDVEIMGAYETATRTLKGVLAQPSLDLEHVERTTEELAEVMASQEEVDQAIRVGGSVAVGAGGAAVDEDELEKELEALVLDEQARQKAEAEAAKREAERKGKEEEERKERDLARMKLEEMQQREREKVAAFPQAPGQAPAGRPGDGAKDAQEVWQKTYDAAQQRESEERARAELERMRREERRLAAE